MRESDVRFQAHWLSCVVPVKVPIPLRLAVVAIAVVLAAIGVIYLVVQCDHIPWPLPGREAGSTDHRFGFAAASFVLAGLGVGVGALARHPRTGRA